MGKSKPRIRNKNRQNPSAKPPSDPKLAAFREQRVLPLLNDLQSAELKTRSSAALAIRTLIEDKVSRKALLRDQLVRIILEQTITDSSLETRKDGWGILRNLALEEESDFCIHLYRQDVLTAIDGVFQTASTSMCLLLKTNLLTFVHRSSTLLKPPTPNSKNYTNPNKNWFGL